MNPFDLVPLLIRSKAIATTRSPDEDRVAWSFCLENPTVFLNNAMMLHPEIAPRTLRTYWTNHILKWLQHTRYHTPMNKEYIKKLLSKAVTVPDHLFQTPWYDGVERVSDNLYRKSNRSADFKRIEKSIQDSATRRKSIIRGIIGHGNKR